MGKIAQEQKNRYFEKVKLYKATIDAGITKEKTLVELLAKDNTGAGYKRLRLAEETLNLCSWFLLVNSLSVSLLGIKNEDYLIEGRKVLVRALKYLEDTVSGYLDAPFSDYEKNLDEIKDLDPGSRFRLVRKFGFTIQSFEEAFGENSKYNLSFVELWGKFAAMAKNLIDLRTYQADSDFSSANRPTVISHMRLVREMNQRCADRYREKYELHSHKTEDFRMAILFVSAQRRLSMLIGDKDEAESLKKKADVWTTKLEADLKKHEAAKR